MWAAVVVVGLASYVLRVLPLLILQHVELSPRVGEALQHAATGAMAVMLMTGVVHLVGSEEAGQVQAAGRTVGVVAGVVIALVLARRGRSLPVVVLAALLAFVAATATAALAG